MYNAVVNDRCEVQKTSAWGTNVLYKELKRPLKHLKYS